MTVKREPGVLPWGGSVTLHDLADCLSRVPTLLGADDSVDLRIVAYLDDDGHWVVYAGALWVGFPEAQDPPVVQMGTLLLASYRGAPADIGSAESLCEFIGQWSVLTGGTVEPRAFSGAGSVSRIGSDQGRLGYPCWDIVLYYAPAAAQLLPPSGPFFDPKTQRFADSVMDACAQWLGDETYRQTGSPVDYLRIIVADPRARIAALQRTPAGVDISIVGTQPGRALTCVTELVAYDGTVDKSMANAVSQAGSVRVSRVLVERPFRQFRAFLFGPDGSWYDRVNEALESPSTRGYALFGITRNPHNDALADALAAGESDHVEFKAWMPTDVSDRKSAELLQAACAFANGPGGVIYIGVNDQIEILGTDRAIRMWASRENKSDSLDQLREAYALRLRARIADGIAPSVLATVSWIPYAGGESICSIKVIGSGAIVHSLVATNEIYVRRGANNRRARPEEINIEAFAIRGRHDNFGL